MRKVTESNEGHELQEYIQLRAHVRGRHKRDHTTAKPELYVKIVMKTFDYTHTYLRTMTTMRKAEATRVEYRREC